MATHAEADVLVVGLGPAGSTCARILAAMGLRVIGIDRSAFPRRKPCGGCITERGKRLLGPTFLPAVEREYYGAKLFAPGGEALSFRSDRVIAYGVSRETFDDLLLREAREAGVDVRLGERLEGAVQEGGFVRALTDRGTCTVRYVVGAEGVRGIVSRMVRDERSCQAMVAYEIRIERWHSDDPQDTLRIYFGGVPGGYGWIFPKEGYTSAGIVTGAWNHRRPQDLLRHFLSDVLHLNGENRVETRGGLIPRHVKGRRENLTRGRFLLVGDSGGLVDPFLAEGVSYAVQSAFLAAMVIGSAAERGDGDLSLYESAVADLLLESFDSAVTLSKYVYGFPKLAFLAIKRRSEIARELFELIRGNMDYEKFIGKFRKTMGMFI